MSRPVDLYERPWSLYLVVVLDIDIHTYIYIHIYIGKCIDVHIYII